MRQEVGGGEPLTRDLEGVDQNEERRAHERNTCRNGRKWKGRANLDVDEEFTRGSFYLSYKRMQVEGREAVRPTCASHVCWLVQKTDAGSNKYQLISTDGE